jgi:hypothetical protein
MTWTALSKIVSSTVRDGSTTSSVVSRTGHCSRTRIPFERMYACSYPTLNVSVTLAGKLQRVDVTTDAGFLYMVTAAVNRDYRATGGRLLF